MTMTLIATATAESAQASLDFVSIPSTYTDLWVEYSIRSTDASVHGKMTVNGSATGYSVRNLIGNGSTATSENLATTQFYLANSIVQSGATANTFSSSSVYIPNYAGSTAKSISVDSTSENNATGGYLGITAGLWSGTAAITSISLAPYNGVNLAAGSTATLWGILKGSGGATVSP